jgi:hypothetical protein
MFDVPAVEPAVPALFSTSIGDIFPSTPTVHEVVNSDHTEFKKQVALMVRHAALDTIKYKSFLVLGFRADAAMREMVFDALIASDCNCVGVMVHTGDECSAVCNRTKVRSKLHLLDGFDGLTASPTFTHYSRMVVTQPRMWRTCMLPSWRGRLRV